MTMTTTSSLPVVLSPPGGRILPRIDTGVNARPGTLEAKARASAEDFESVFLQTMIQEMLSGLGKDGPLGEGEAGGAWRSILVQDYASTIAKAGGIGIADSVYPNILALQESGAAGTTAKSGAVARTRPQTRSIYRNMTHG